MVGSGPGEELESFDLFGGWLLMTRRLGTPLPTVLPAVLRTVGRIAQGVATSREAWALPSAVQDSYYKDLHVDLAKYTLDIAAAAGFSRR